MYDVCDTRFLKNLSTHRTKTSYEEAHRHHGFERDVVLAEVAAQPHDREVCCVAHGRRHARSVRDVEPQAEAPAHEGHEVALEAWRERRQGTTLHAG